MPMLRLSRPGGIGRWKRQLYGWAKDAYEHLGFVFASGGYGRKLPVVQVRIGAPRPIVATVMAMTRRGTSETFGAYVSPRDLAQLFCRAIDAPTIDNEHGVPFIIRHLEQYARVLEHRGRRSVLGYQPEDNSEIVFQKDIAAWLMKPPGSPGKMGTR